MHAKLPTLASDIQVLANEAPSHLQKTLRTIDADVQTLVNEPVPTTRAQSSQEVAPIEQAAPGLQRGLKALDCQVKDQSVDAGNSGSTTGARSLWVVLLFGLLNLPLIRRVWRFRRKPALTSDGSRFKGSLRRWRVQALTGQVLNVQRGSVTRTYAGEPDVAGGYRPITSVTSTRETIRLALVDGGQTDVSLVDSLATPTKGDFLTVGIAQKRSRSVNFAVLNHTTHRQLVRPDSLLSLGEKGCLRQTTSILGLIFGGLITTFLAVFGGAEWLFAIYLGLIALYAVLTRRVGRMDVQPLWRRGAAELQTLHT